MTEQRQAINAVSRTKKAAFLNALRETGDHQQACELAGIATCTPRQWARRSKEFAEEFRFAREQGDTVLLSVLEAEIKKRALAGPSDPGSSNLLMFRTKRLDPAYRENAAVNVNAIGPVAIQLNFTVPASGTEALPEGTTE